MKIVHAFGIHVWLSRRIHQRWICVPSVTKRVVRCANEFVSESQIQRQVLANPVVILHKPCVAGNTVVVIPQSPATFSEQRRACQESLKVCGRVWQSTREEH